MIPAVIARTGWTFDQVLALTLPQLRSLVEFWTVKPKKKGERGLSELDMFNFQSGIKRVKKPL